MSRFEWTVLQQAMEYPQTLQDPKRIPTSPASTGNFLKLSSFFQLSSQFTACTRINGFQLFARLL